MATDWGNKFQNFIFFLVGTIFVGIALYWLYGAVSSGTGAIQLLQGVSVIGLLAFLAIAMVPVIFASGEKRKLESETILILIFAFAAAFGFFMYQDKIFQAFSMLPLPDHSVLPKSITQAFSMIRP